ncbi:hypothetical protein BDW22DRAFT_331452 [Trametopsis cervina]|nr:hypothetical protein BDW22DRAFT_331452 [Trametopsis cervina]
MLYYCDICDKGFSTSKGLLQHENTRHSHYHCDTCDAEFRTTQGLTRHYIQSTAHPYCRYCDEHFEDRVDLTYHFKSEHDYCGACEKVFGSVQALDDHWRKGMHWYCNPCQHIFLTEHGFYQHLTASAIHNPRTKKCPGKRCNRSFVSHGDLLLHLESGACPSGMTRQRVNTLAILYDEDNVITDPSRLVEDQDSEEAEVVGCWATEGTWNGDAYECYLCHKTFRTLSSLNSHLGSPAHADKIYRCPTQFNGCDRHLKTLSGLLHHIERSGCGVTRFRQPIAGGLDGIMQDMRRLTV